MSAKLLSVTPFQTSAWVLVSALTTSYVMSGNSLFDLRSPTRVSDVHCRSVQSYDWQAHFGQRYDVWQRPPHFVPGLLAKPWHEHYPTIRAEYDAYMGKLQARKDWDDTDLTPGLGDVGNRPGAKRDTSN
eukprot:6461378-Amphidinium_carterae.3